MTFTEQDAIKIIQDLLNFNDYYKIIQVLKNINPEVFKNETVKKAFKEILVNMYNNDNINYLKDMLNKFIGKYNEYQPFLHRWFCSKQFREKFKRSDFNNPAELKRFRDLIIRILQLRTRYQTEDMGEFFISPRGHERHRIIWYIKDDAVYFCEPMHHDKEYEYFSTMAAKRKLLRKYYTDWDSIENFQPLNLATI